jgi:hypothetical protein
VNTICRINHYALFYHLLVRLLLLASPESVTNSRDFFAYGHEGHLSFQHDDVPPPNLVLSNGYHNT